jgi:autotransporter-associated beta strand protein
LQATHANALGSTSNGTTVASGAALEVSGGITIAEDLTLNGVGINDGSFDRGALRSTGGNNFMTGNITLGPYTRINSDAGTLTFNGTIAGGANVLYLGCTGNITINGAISGSGGSQDYTTTSLFKDSAGTLTLSGNNIFTGDTRIVGGTLLVDTGGSLGTGSDVFIGSNSSLAVNTSTTVASINDWSSGNAGTISIGSGSTLTVNGTSSATFSGVIGGSGSLAKAGTGTLTLNGTNTCMGTTTVNGGTLQANATNALGSTSGITVTTGGTLLVSANGALGSSTAITMNSTATGNGTAASLVFNSSYNGTVGELVLNANSIFDLGTDPLGVQVHFSSITGLDTYTLSIYNWTGTTLWEGGTGNNLDQIYAGNELSDSELAHISFYSGLDTSSFRGTGYQIMSGSFLNELGPVPEPATWVAMVALVFGGGLCAFRRRIVQGKEL